MIEGIEADRFLRKRKEERKRRQKVGMLMDSGNSSSMQSNSSGGDDQEYDSRSFLPPAPAPAPPPQALFSPQDPDFLQPFSDFRDPVFINWPNSGSDPNYASFPVAGPGGSSSTASLPPPPPPPSSAPTSAPQTKNPKKRTRASRRAPTTVLTTDTSNFRAMVQEFTGIPAPPFAAAATSAYSRLLGGPYRPASQSQRLLPSEANNMFSSSLLNLGGQSQLLGSGQQMGLPKFSGQPDPILQSLLLQQQQSQLLGYQRDHSAPSNIARLNAAFGNVGDDGSNNSNNNIYSNTNNKE